MMPIRRVLCPIDLSEATRRALDHAAAIARRYEATLAVLHVVQDLSVIHVPPPLLDEVERDRITRQMREAAAHLPPDVPLDFRIVEASRIDEAIIADATQRTADLLVLGSHGRSGFSRLLLGSVTEKLVRRSPCPALVVPPRAADTSPDGPVQFQRFLCAVDFSEGSTRALRLALDLAADMQARVTALHVIETPPEVTEVPRSMPINLDQVRAAAEADVLRRLREPLSREALTAGLVRTAVRHGTAYREIVSAAAEEQADLIVMGVRGRNAIDLAVFGSNTARVLRMTACPVLIVSE